MSEKDALRTAYQTLLEEHRVLQATVDDLSSEKEEALAQARQVAADVDQRQDEKIESALKNEIDRLRTELCVSWHCGASRLTDWLGKAEERGSSCDG
jgi:protein HOOK3